MVEKLDNMKVSVFLLMLITFRVGAALIAEDVSTALPFTEAGKLVSSVQYLPLAFNFNMSAMILQAETFEAEVAGQAKSNTTAEFMAHGQAYNFATEPLQDLRTVQELFMVAQHVQKRQAGVIMGAAAMATSAWALADAEQAKSMAMQLQKNQVKMAHVVDGVVARVQQQDLLLRQANESLAIIKKSYKEFIIYTGYFGYFSATRQYTRSVNQFCRGVEALMSHRITPALVNTTVVAAAFKALESKAAEEGLEPVFPDWQQVYLHESAFVYIEDVLQALHFVPFKPMDSTTWLLRQLTSTPWIIHGKLVEFRPHHSLIVIGEADLPKAHLPGEPSLSLSLVKPRS